MTEKTLPYQKAIRVLTRLPNIEINKKPTSQLLSKMKILFYFATFFNDSASPLDSALDDPEFIEGSLTINHIIYPVYPVRNAISNGV